MFSAERLGLTITEDEITTSYFPDNWDAWGEMSEEERDKIERNFVKKCVSLLNNLHHGNAGTTLQNALRMAEVGRIGELADLQEKMPRKGLGNIWSGAIERRRNYSTFYNANTRRFDSETGGRDFRSNYRAIYEEGQLPYTASEGRVPNTDLTLRDVRRRIRRVLQSTESEMPLTTADGIEITQEEQRIKEAAQADGTFMLAPDGSATKLTEKQWLQVRTEAFRRWFGDSIVKDANGEPKVVYRGSRNAGSRVLRSRYQSGALWFTDSRAVAEHYARRAADHELSQEELGGYYMKKFFFIFIYFMYLCMRL